MAKVALVQSGAQADDTVDTDARSMPDGGGEVPVEPPGGPGGGSGLTRVTVNLNKRAVEALESVSQATGYSKTDTINRALQIYAIVEEIMGEDDGPLNIVRRDGSVERLRIV